MIRDITLGRYYAADSPVHRLDSRVKITGVLLYIADLFIVDDFIGFGLCAAALCLYVVLSQVPVKFIMRGLKPILLILIMTFCLNIFMVDGRILWQWGFLKVTDEGIYTAVFMAVRLGISQGDRRGNLYGGVHGRKAHSSHHRIVAAHSYHQAHRAYRRHRETHVSSGKYRSSGSRYSHDHVYRLKVHTNAPGGDG